MSDFGSFGENHGRGNRIPINEPLQVKYRGVWVEAVTCKGCSACCKAGVVMALSDDEAKLLSDAGTELELQEEAPKKPRRFPLSLLRPKDNPTEYQLLSDCSFLVEETETGEQICSIYDDPNRPEICGVFEMGGEPCREIRYSEGVDTWQQFREFLDRTALG